MYKYSVYTWDKCCKPIISFVINALSAHFAVLVPIECRYLLTNESTVFCLLVTANSEGRIVHFVSDAIK